MKKQNKTKTKQKQILSHRENWTSCSRSKWHFLRCHSVVQYIPESSPRSYFFLQFLRIPFRGKKDNAFAYFIKIKKINKFELFAVRLKLCLLSNSCCDLDQRLMKSIKIKIHVWFLEFYYAEATLIEVKSPISQIRGNQLTVFTDQKKRLFQNAENTHNWTSWPFAF